MISLSMIILSAMSTPTDLNLVVQNAVRQVAASGMQKPWDEANVALTLWQLDFSGVRAKGEFRGEERFITASVVKLFWLAFAAHRVDQGKVEKSDEVERAARDMIVDSSNDATGYIVNVTTDADPGGELHGAAYDKWLVKRNEANLWFQSLGYQNIHVMHRTYNEGAYGRERQALGKDLELRNRLTTNSTVRLMTEIMQGKVVSPAWCNWMRSLLHRSVPADDPKADGQARYIGSALPKGSQLWSKAGWTSLNRHDVAAFELPDGRRYVLAVFTNYGGNEKIVPAFSKAIVDQLWPSSQ